MFAIGQAAKATEKEALAFAHGAGKRVLGVLNKVDRADAVRDRGGHPPRRGHARRAGRDHRPVLGHAGPRGPARRRGPTPTTPRSASALEERFFTQALALKRATALSSLRRFLAAARAAAGAAARPPPDFAAARAALARLARNLRGALDGERVALRARIDEAYRRAALEVREFVRPRSWLFGEHRATPADEEFLGELLEDAVTGAVDRSRADPARGPQRARRGERPRRPRRSTARDAAARAIDTAVDRFAAYARGVIEGGAVPDFFRHQLPRLRLDVGRDPRRPRAPRARSRGGAVLAAAPRARRRVRARPPPSLATAEIDAEMRLSIHAERMRPPARRPHGRRRRARTRGTDRSPARGEP